MRDAAAPAGRPVRSPLAPATTGRGELWALAVPPSAEPRLHLRCARHPRARAAATSSRSGGRGHRGPVGNDRGARAWLPGAIRLPAEAVPGMPGLLLAAGGCAIAPPGRGGRVRPQTEHAAVRQASEHGVCCWAVGPSPGPRRRRPRRAARHLRRQGVVVGRRDHYEFARGLSRSSPPGATSVFEPARG